MPITILFNICNPLGLVNGARGTCYQKPTKIKYFSDSTMNAVEEFIDILSHAMRPELGGGR
jgi:hypothetical protein